MAAPQITPLPEAPDKRDDPLNFEEKADEFLGALPTFGNEANTLATAVNGYADNAAISETNAANSELAAVSAANYKGEWSGLTGVLNIPASVAHNSNVWALKSNLADVTTSEPSDTNSDWINLTGFQNLYEPVKDYPIGSRVTGSDGNRYNARKASGPNLGGAVDPVNDTTLTWTTTELSEVGQIVKLPYVPTAQEKLTKRLLEANGASLLDSEYPELLSSLGGKIYGNIDSTHFYIPFYSGKFLRALDNGAGIDQDKSTRTDRGDGVTGDNVGTNQLDALQEITGTLEGAGGSLSWVGAYNTSGAFTSKVTTTVKSTAAGSGTGITGVNFNASNSVAPNIAKTSDFQTMPINTYVWVGIYY